MKRLLFILFLALCATAHAQTIRSLGYNSTNGHVVAATNVVWTNAFSFSTNAVAAQVRTNLGLAPFTAPDGYAELRDATNGLVLQVEDGVLLYREISFGGAAAVSNSRVNLGLPLPALTNTSNVTAMRALSGSTNTNHPFSGSISVTGTNNTNTLVFSNGVLQSVQ